MGVLELCQREVKVLQQTESSEGDSKRIEGRCDKKYLSCSLVGISGWASGD